MGHKQLIPRKYLLSSTAHPCVVLSYLRCLARKSNPLQNICNNFRIIKQTNRNTIRQKGKGVVINHGKGGGGVATKWEGGGSSEVLPLQKKRGARAGNVFTIMKGGGAQQVLG